MPDIKDAPTSAFDEAPAQKIQYSRHCTVGAHIREIVKMGQMQAMNFIFGTT